MKKRLSSIFLICVMVLTMANPAALAVDAELEADPLTQGTEAGEPQYQALEVDIKRSTANATNHQIPNAIQNSATRSDAAVTLDLAAGAIIIDTAGYRQGDTHQTYTGSYRLTTSEETGNSITVESGKHELILNGVKIKATDSPAISIQKDASAVITLKGENELTGGPCYAGLYVEVDADVTIDGAGSLIAQGGIFESKDEGTGAGAGIGGNGAQIKDSKVQKWCDFGGITIKGGMIDATGGAIYEANYGAGAGIGGGGSTLEQGKLEGLAELEGSILIENGTVTASGGADHKSDSWGGAGIGSGGAGNTNLPHRSDIKVTIKGGTVTAKGGSIAAGIGGSNSIDGGKIAITGGQVEAIGNDDSGSWGGAGIGGGDNGGVKEIKIAGNAQVTAKGGGHAAGIGGGTDRGVDIIQDDDTVKPGSITIGGSAVVTAYGSSYGAGIGAGYSDVNEKNGCGTITISDSAKVTAFAGKKAQAIGVGAGYTGDDENRLAVSGSGVQVWMFNQDTAQPAFWGQNKAGNDITDAYTGNGVATVWYTGSAIPNVDIISDAYSTASDKSYRWSHNAARELKILSDEEEVQKGSYPDGFTLGNWAAIFSADTCEVTASVSGAGGTVSPASQSVAPGGNAAITITREHGYKLSKITVNGTAVEKLPDGNTFTLSNVQNDAAISISFVEMTAKDVEEITDKLPPIKDGDEITDDTKQTILDTKMDYEALSEEEKAAMPETQKEKLHEALSQMPNIEVKVEVQIAGGEQGVFSVPEHQKPALLENMTIEEAAELKSNAAATYKIIVTVTEAKPDAAAESSIQGELNGATAAEKHDVTVKKVMSKNGTDENTEPISTLVKPIQLEFSIPEKLRTPPPQTERTFMLLRTHDQGGGAYTTQVLDGTVDRERWIYVVESNKFSVYTLAYVDTKQDIPTVTAQPSANVTYGTPVTLTVSPTGSGWMYVWYKDANGNGTLDLDTDIKMDGNASSLTLNDVADSGTYWAQVSTGADAAVSTAVAVTIQKATPTLSFVPSAESLKGGGSVTLTVGQVPGGGSVTVSCDNSIVVTQNEDGTYSATLPNSNQTYTFTAAYAGDENHNAGTATCTVRVTERGGSSSGSSRRYTVSAGSAQNGAVQVSPENAARGDAITVRVKPDVGYRLEDLTATDSRGNELKMTDKGGGIFTFAMPGSKVLVQASFVPENASESELPFVDVHGGDWFYQAVAYVYREGLMSGTTGTTFKPGDSTTRGMIATILHRLENAPAAAAAAFDDVAAGQYYTDAVAWAAGKGIVLGYGDGSFGPNDPITREQLAAILYRFAGYKGHDVSAADSLSGFSDSASVSGYAVEAMGWAVQTGLISGMSDGTLRPRDSATRAQAAMILTRFMQNINE